ncbi:MAG: nitroreductase family protein [Tannerella sp.]|jgi:predicted oxidoreductase (fatty acid repression mutant protein)|nr:nitroreductase family protein [Tannerella sp.]
MERTYKEAVERRRSYYAIDKRSPISDAEIEALVRLTVTHVPSAFNSQSTGVVLLLGAHHTKLWSIVKETLRKIVPAAAFENTEKKINAFDAGYGTLLYFEDQREVKTLQEQFPLYAEQFPFYSEHTSAMHQITLWTLLEDAGLGASLQHYNPLIDEEVRQTWHLPEDWKLIAQMPFGVPVQEPGTKTFKPLDNRIRVFNELRIEN